MTRERVASLLPVAIFAGSVLPIVTVWLAWKVGLLPTSRPSNAASWLFRAEDGLVLLLWCFMFDIGREYLNEIRNPSCKRDKETPLFFELFADWMMFLIAAGLVAFVLGIDLNATIGRLFASGDFRAMRGLLVCQMSLALSFIFVVWAINARILNRNTGI